MHKAILLLIVAFYAVSATGSDLCVPNYYFVAVVQHHVMIYTEFNAMKTSYGNKMMEQRRIANKAQALTGSSQCQGIIKASNTRCRQKATQYVNQNFYCDDCAAVSKKAERF